MGAFVTRCFWIEERKRGRSNLARWTTNVPERGATSMAMIEPSTSCDISGGRVESERMTDRYDTWEETISFS